MDDRNVERNHSIYFINEIDKPKKNDFFSGQVKTYHFKRCNSLAKESKNEIKRKNFNGNIFKKVELNEYKGSLNYLDKIDDRIEHYKSNYFYKNFDENCASSDDYTDDYNNISEKKPSLNMSKHKNEFKKQIEINYFNKTIFEKNVSSIFTLMVLNIIILKNY